MRGLSIAIVLAIGVSVSLPAVVEAPMAVAQASAAPIVIRTDERRGKFGFTAGGRTFFVDTRLETIGKLFSPPEFTTMDMWQYASKGVLIQFYGKGWIYNYNFTIRPKKEFSECKAATDTGLTKNSTYTQAYAIYKHTRPREDLLEYGRGLSFRSKYRDEIGRRNYVNLSFEGPRETLSHISIGYVIGD